jgi:hypothetical protein
MGLKALRAVNRAVASGLKRDLGLFSAARSGDGVHLAWRTIVASAATTAVAATTTTIATAVAVSSRPAVRATRRLVGEALTRVELLLARGESESLPALMTRQCFVGVHALTPPSDWLPTVGQRDVRGGRGALRTTLSIPAMRAAEHFLTGALYHRACLEGPPGAPLARHPVRADPRAFPLY